MAADRKVFILFLLQIVSNYDKNRQTPEFQQIRIFIFCINVQTEWHQDHLHQFLFTIRLDNGILIMLSHNGNTSPQNDGGYWYTMVVERSREKAEATLPWWEGTAFQQEVLHSSHLKTLALESMTAGQIKWTSVDRGRRVQRRGHGMIVLVIRPTAETKFRHMLVNIAAFCLFS